MQWDSEMDVTATVVLIRGFGNKAADIYFVCSKMRYKWETLTAIHTSCNGVKH